MNRFTLLLTLVALTGYAQQPLTVIEYGPQARQMHMQSNTDIQTALNKLVQKSEEQLNALNSLVDWYGDFGENADSVLDAKMAILGNTQTATLTTQELMDARASAQGSDVFTDGAYGAFKGIGTTYEKTSTNAEGETVTTTENRKAENYTEEAKRLKDITEFYRVRDESLEKQKALEAARLEAHLALLETEDQVETQRLAVQISTIDAELIAVRQDVANATHELEVHEKAIQVQAMADAKAQMEAAGRDSGSMMQNVEAMQESVREAVDQMRETSETNSQTNGEGGRGRLPFGSSSD